MKCSRTAAAVTVFLQVNQTQRVKHTLLSMSSSSSFIPLHFPKDSLTSIDTFSCSKWKPSSKHHDQGQQKASCAPKENRNVGAGLSKQKTRGLELAWIHWTDKWYGEFHKWGYTIAWWIMENPIKMMIWGYPYFRKPPYHCLYSIDLAGISNWDAASSGTSPISVVHCLKHSCSVGWRWLE